MIRSVKALEIVCCNKLLSYGKDVFLAARILLLVILLPLPAISVALGVSDFTFSHLGLADGLNSRRIYSLRQTDDGAVWMTVKNNVARYNGVSIENFELTPPGMCSVEECSPRFVQTEDKTLQVFDAGGRIYEYNAVQNRFDMVADVARFFKRYNKLNDVYKSGDTYWLAMGDGVFMFRGGKLLTVAPGMYANCIIRGPEGRLLFGTRKGVKSLRLDKNGSHAGPLKPYLPYDVISSYYECSQQAALARHIRPGSGHSRRERGVYICRGNTTQPCTQHRPLL